MWASSPEPPAVFADSDVVGALSKKLWNSHLLSGVTTEPLCELFEEPAPTEFPVYFSVKVSCVVFATDATFLNSLSGPNTKISPTLTWVVKVVPNPLTVLDPFVTVTLPVKLELNAFELAQTLTFKLLPNSPGYLPIQLPTPEIPDE